MKHYEKFLKEETTSSIEMTEFKDGTYVLKENIGSQPLEEVERSLTPLNWKNRIACEAVGAVYSTLSLLRSDVKTVMITSGDSFHFEEVKLDENGFVEKYLTKSKALSREKTLEANTYELAQAVIEIFRERDQWEKYPETVEA